MYDCIEKVERIKKKESRKEVNHCETISNVSDEQLEYGQKQPVSLMIKFEGILNFKCKQSCAFVALNGIAVQ